MSAYLDALALLRTAQNNMGPDQSCLDDEGRDNWDLISKCCDGLENLKRQHDLLLAAMEFAREKIAYLHMEAGDGDCHYQIIDDAIAAVEGGA